MTSDERVGTGSTTTRVLGVAVLAALALHVWLAFGGTPPDTELGETVRLLYLHVPVVSIGYLACLLTTVASAVWLWRRTQWWDLVASSAAELATLFIALTLITGMFWGRPTWGVWWVWDARLTSTLMLFLLLCGYLALRRVPAPVEVRNRRTAVLGLLLVPNVMIVNRSVEWWRSLHQDATLFRTDLNPTIDGLQLFTMFYGMVVASLLFAWLLIHRFRVGYLEEQVADLELDAAVADRRAEAGVDDLSDDEGDDDR